MGLYGCDTKMRMHIWSISLYLSGYLTHNKAELALKQETLLMQGFSTVELRRGWDSNPRRGYKPLTPLAGGLPSVKYRSVAYR